MSLHNVRLGSNSIGSSFPADSFSNVYRVGGSITLGVETWYVPLSVVQRLFHTGKDGRHPFFVVVLRHDKNAEQHSHVKSRVK